jgi:2-polyprenyl-6-methoxyphenol hydroxylase-like FAD-dependent oxidoreductase
MNVSMQDASNLGWKLISVLMGRSPASLLRTHSAKRRAIAQELIGFDREWAACSAPSPRQYIADVLPLDAQDELAVCFDRILLRRS